MRSLRFPAGIDQQSFGAAETTLGVINIPYVYAPPTIIGEMYREIVYGQNNFSEDIYSQIIFQENSYTITM